MIHSLSLTQALSQAMLDDLLCLCGDNIDDNNCTTGNGNYKLVINHTWGLQLTKFFFIIPVDAY